MGAVKKTRRAGPAELKAMIQDDLAEAIRTLTIAIAGTNCAGAMLLPNSKVAEASAVLNQIEFAAQHLEEARGRLGTARIRLTIYQKMQKQKRKR